MSITSITVKSDTEIAILRNESRHGGVIGFIGTSRVTGKAQSSKDHEIRASQLLLSPQYSE
jgi:hypothetical protein